MASGNTSSKLTICSVSYNHSRHLLTNIALARFLNPNIKIEWLIANNRPEDTFDEIIKTYNSFIKVVNGPPNNFEGHGKGSKHHAAGLDLIVSQTKTRFILILDPDFYIIMPNWAERVIKYMVKGGIAIFGVPWHPRWVAKYRNFPCIHCLFIDTTQIDISSISFMPQFENKGPLNSWKYFLSKIPLLRDRAYVGCSKDTGIQLYERYFNSSKIRYGLAVPSFSPIDLYNFNKKYFKYNYKYRILINLRVLFGKTLDKVFPESMSVFPKRKGYFTETCFSELGFPDCKSFGWEEFFWNNAPFGFHIRGRRQKPAERNVEVERIRNVLQMFTNKSMRDNLRT